MKKTSILFFVFILAGSISNAKSFNFLSSSTAVKVDYVAKEEGYKNIHLLGVNNNIEFDSLPLKLTVRIGRDVLIDYFTIGDAINKDIKTLYLFEGDSVTVELNLLSSKSLKIDNIKGNLKFLDSMVIKSDLNKTIKTFTGEYWDVKKLTMFRFEKYDSLFSVAKLNVFFTENYPFDKFHYQINVIKPDSSFYSVEGSIVVTNKKNISFHSAEIQLIQELDVLQHGKYIIEVVPLMGIQRINGIKSIGYQLFNDKE